MVYISLPINAAMKKRVLLLLLLLHIVLVNAQVVYHETFGNYSLTNGYQHITAPMTMLNTSAVNSSFDTLTAPFNTVAYANDSWALMLYEGDTVAVTTANKYPSNDYDRWLVTPAINNVPAGARLSWKSLGMNPTSTMYTGTYEVWITTSWSMSMITPADFTNNAGNCKDTVAWEQFDDFENHYLDLSAYAGQNIRVGFRNVSNAWYYQLLLDDITVAVPVMRDVEADAVVSHDYALPGSIEVGLRISDWGTQNVSNVTLNCSVGGGPVTTQTVATTLAYSEVDTMMFSVPVNAPNLGVQDLHVWISAINGQSDIRPSDDSAHGSIRIISSAPHKRVLLAEQTGAWCGWCPGGGHVLDSLEAANPDVIGASLHYDDSLQFQQDLEFVYAFLGYFPGGYIDRIRYQGEWLLNTPREHWPALVTDRLNDVVPAEVQLQNITYNSTTRQVTATVKADFWADADGDLRLNCWLTEDAVTGPPNDTGDNGWNNHNYYDNIPNTPFYGLGPLLDASEYQHNDVFSLCGSPSVWGDPVIPATVTAGQSFQKTYTFTLPTPQYGEVRWKPNDMHVIGFLSRYTTHAEHRTVINSAADRLIPVGVNEMAAADHTLSVFPNPSSDLVMLRWDNNSGKMATVEVLDLNGRVVASASSLSAATFDVSGWAAGLYVVRVICDGERLVRKLSVQH